MKEKKKRGDGKDQDSESGMLFIERMDPSYTVRQLSHVRVRRCRTKALSIASPLGMGVRWANLLPL